MLPSGSIRPSSRHGSDENASGEGQRDGRDSYSDRIKGGPVADLTDQDAGETQQGLTIVNQYEIGGNSFHSGGLLPLST